MKKFNKIICIFGMLFTIIFGRNAFGDIPASERQALIDLYNSTDGANWTNNTNWLGTNGTECSWHGVTCDSSGNHVIKLYLVKNKLSGSIPSSISNLSELIELWLGENQLSGEIPSSIGNLSNLEYLVLLDNQLNGSIPSQIINLSNLLYLSLGSNQLSGNIPSNIANLTKLTWLSLYFNQLSGNIPSSIGILSNLTHLQLQGNQLSDGIPIEIGNLSNLRLLSLSTNKLSGNIPSEIGNLSNLTRLYLGGNQLTGNIPSQISQLSDLTLLSLGNNQLSGSIQVEIANLSNLEELYLNDNQLSGSIPFELGKLSNLIELRLGGNQLNGNIPSEIGNLSNLTHLQLGGNQLNGSIPIEIGKLSNLARLYLNDNQLSGSIPSEIGNLSKLEYLNLCGNSLYTSDNVLRDFLNTKQSNWESCQKDGTLLANFSADKTSGNAPLNVQFTDLSAGNPRLWKWDFDNDSVTDFEIQNPTWTYNQPGTYTVSLTVSDDANTDKEIKTDYITVNSDDSNVIYSNDFEKYAGSEWSNTSTDVTPTGNRTFLGQFGNGTISLSLNNLPKHNEVTVSFDLFIIRSWDGNRTSWGPDRWNLVINGGETLINTTFSNYTNQAYPENYPDGNNPYRTGAVETDTLGYGTVTDGDSVYHLSFSFSHTEENLQLDFSGIGLEGLANESWGLDNIKVKLGGFEGVGANFAADYVKGDVPLKVQFTDLSIGNPTSLKWDFNNDGVIDSTEQNPTWTYEQPGTYTLSLTVSDGTSQNTITRKDYITVTIPPPNLKASELKVPSSATSLVQPEISWQVKNTAKSPTNEITDSLYISSDNILDEKDTLFGAFARTEGLNAESDYWRTEKIQIPDTVIPGSYYIIVKTDSKNAISETDEEDNIAFQPITIASAKLITAAPDRIPLNLNPGVPVTGKIEIGNISNKAVSGLAYTVKDAAANITVQLSDFPTELQSMTSHEVTYTVTAGDLSVPESKANLLFTGSEKAAASITFEINVVPGKPRLETNPGYLEYGILRGKQSFYEFEIVNSGGASANDLEVLTPDASWLKLITPKIIGNLAPGAITKIGLKLTPPENMLLGPYEGGIIVRGSNIAIRVGFRFITVSEAKGNLKITATDEFTYFADDHPNVKGATVILTDAFSGAEIVKGVTDEKGIFTAENINEARYNVEVRAEKHGTYRNTFEIKPGLTKEIEAFLPRQLVTYRWSVEPVQIEDHYTVTLEAVFETHVPAPVVTVEPNHLFIPLFKGETTTVDLKITNHGLIAAKGVALTLPQNEEIYIETPILNIGDLGAMTSVTVPIKVRAKEDGPISPITKNTPLKQNNISIKKGQTDTGISEMEVGCTQICVGYYYVCNNKIYRSSCVSVNFMKNIGEWIEKIITIIQPFLAVIGIEKDIALCASVFAGDIPGVIGCLSLLCRSISLLNSAGIELPENITHITSCFCIAVSLVSFEPSIISTVGTAIDIRDCIGSELKPLGCISTKSSVSTGTYIQSTSTQSEKITWLNTITTPGNYIENPVYCKTVLTPQQPEITSSDASHASGTANPNTTFILSVSIGCPTIAGNNCLYNFKETIKVDSSGSWLFNMPGLCDGTYTIVATVIDGNSSPINISKAVNLIIETGTPDKPVITEPVNGSLLNDNTPIILGTSEPKSLIRVYAKKSFVGETFADICGEWSFIPLTPLNDGIYSITANATDAANNTSPESFPVSITIDTK